MSTKQKGAFEEIFGMASSLKPPKPKIKQYQLTPIGRDKVQKYELDGLKFDVLAVLKSKEPCTCKELAQYFNRSTESMQHILSDLEEEQLVMARGM